MAGFSLPMNTFFKIGLAISVILWVLWGIANYIFIYGNPGIFFSVIASTFVPQMFFTIITLALFLINKLSEEGALPKF